MQFPVPAPPTIVDRYPWTFNSDDSLSDDGVKDNTLSINIPPLSDGVGVPVMTGDLPKLASSLAIVDNTMGDPDLVTDPLMA